MANACYFHQALVEKMFAVINSDVCICSFVYECEWFMNVNAKLIGITLMCKSENGNIIIDVLGNPIITDNLVTVL